MTKDDLPSLDDMVGFPEDPPVRQSKRRFYELTMGSATYEEQLPTPEDPRVQVHALTEAEIAQIRPPQPSFTALDFEVWDYLTRTKSYQPGQLVTAEEVEKALLQVEGKYHDILRRCGAGANMYYSTLVKFGEPVEPWGTVRLTGRAWEADVVQAALQLLNEHAQILRERAIHGEADRLAQEKAMLLMDISRLEQERDALVRRARELLREDEKERIDADLADLRQALETGGPRPWLRHGRIYP